jgi:alanyl-tRNA synthetase
VKTAEDVRDAFIKFFESQGHTKVASAPLLAHNDASLLFTNSGMVQFKDTFAGIEKRDYTRAVSCQKCLRVSGKHNDLDDVGRTRRHHTFFEMLGNFSFGDYFKADAIRFGWQFVTDILNLDKHYLWVTVHENDAEAEELWKSLTDVDPGRIVKLGDATNLWSMGDVGPWGYCSEIFYYMGHTPESQSHEEFLKDDGTYLEIWNLVFMQYLRDASGESKPLPLQCIDTGMGLERVTCVLQGLKSNYDVDLFRGLIGRVEQLSGLSYSGSNYQGEARDEHYESDVAMRVIADHVRSAVFLVADGVSPGNEGANYVLRRIMRRAIKHSLVLGLNKPFMAELAELVIESMGSAYPELKVSAPLIIRLIAREEEQFRKTLHSGMNILERWLSENEGEQMLPGELAFKLYDTYGFPLDVTQDILADRQISVDCAGFDSEMQKQRERSKSGAKALQVQQGSSLGDFPETTFTGYSSLEGESQLLHVEKLKTGKFALIFESTPFYAEMGGQIGDQGSIVNKDIELQVIDTIKLGHEQYGHVVDQLPDGIVSNDLIGGIFSLQVAPDHRRAVARHHSATHLLHAALREVLGDHVAQRGSLVTNERLRFDFSHFQALTVDELHAINTLVNEQIRANYPCQTQELSYDDAISAGALAFFGDKYGSSVRVVTLGPRSMELCGGTHVGYTGEIGFHVLVSEGSISSGVRRVECLVGRSAEDYLWGQGQSVQEAAQLLKGNASSLVEKVSGLLATQRELKGQVKELQSQLAQQYSRELTTLLKDGGVVHRTYSGLSKDLLQEISDCAFGGVLPESIVLSLYDEDSRLMLLRSREGGVDCRDIANALRTAHGIKGGGNRTSATLVGVLPTMISDILGYLETHLAGV